VCPFVHSVCPLYPLSVCAPLTLASLGPAIHLLTPSLKYPLNLIDDVHAGLYHDINAIRLRLCRPLSSYGTITDLPPFDFAELTPECESHLAGMEISPSEANRPMIFVSNVDPLLLDHACALSFFEALATNAAVCSVEPMIRPKTWNKMASWITQSGEQYGGETKVHPLWANGITGKNQIVQCSDSGLDVDNQYFWDSTCAVNRDKSGQYKDCRKVVQYYAFVDGTDDNGGHGTHVVGSIVGRRSANGVTEGERRRARYFKQRA